MKKKMLIGCILAAVVIVFAGSLAPVVGFQTAKLNTKNTYGSPLFAVRTQRSLHKEDTKKISSSYLGEEKTLNLFFLKKSSLQNWIDKAMKFVNVRPEFLKIILNRLDKNPQIVNILKEHGINKNELNKYIALAKSDPSVLRQEMDKAVQMLGEQLEMAMTEPSDPEPLGLPTTLPEGILGCYILIFILTPIMIVIGTIIATLTIITCLNVNDCLTKIIQAILTWSQGLTLPDY